MTECFVIFAHFLLFYPTNNPENQNFEKIKKTPGDIIVLLTCTKNPNICYTIPEIWHVTDVIFIFRFGLFFALLPYPPPLNKPRNQNFK